MLAARDPKGLYKKALAGELPNFTGVSDPYEAPLTPEVAVDSSLEGAEEACVRIWSLLNERGLVRP